MSTKLNNLYSIAILAMFIPCVTFSQMRLSDTEIDKTWLKITSSFLGVVKEARLDLDSTLKIASERNRLSRIPIIIEGIDILIPMDSCRWMDTGNLWEPLSKLKKSPAKSRTRLLLLLGAYYSFEPNMRHALIRQAETYLQQAINECTLQHLEVWSIHCKILLAKCYLKENNVEKAKVLFDEAATAAKKMKDIRLEAKAYAYEAIYFPFSFTSFDFRISCAQKAEMLYKMSGEDGNRADILMDIAYLTVASGKIVEARSSIQQSLLIQKKMGFPYTHYSNDLLAFIARLSADYVNHLQLALSEVQNAEITKDSIGLAYFYARVADAYELAEDHIEESSIWYKKSLGEFQKHGGDPALYRIFTSPHFIDHGFTGSDSTLHLIQQLLKTYPPTNTIDEQCAYIALSHCYQGLHQSKNTEEYLLKAAALEPANRKIRGNIHSGYIYSVLGSYYHDKKDSKNSRRYNLMFIENARNTYVDSLLLMDSYWKLFMADSASNPSAGLRYLHKYTLLREKIHSTVKDQQLNELNVKYQAVQRQRDLDMYKTRSEAQVQQAKVTRKFSLITLVLLFIIIAVILRGYLAKKKGAKILEEQRDEISQKNNQLLHVINEKDGLLKAREWLLKEVHHRVKNNLQLVISLLNSQTIYLKDESALNAMLESRHRVQAMAIIHQKLYKMDNLSNINMRDYITTLVDYLKESFRIKHEILFDLQIMPIDLDVSQAIPLGLILNELITNAIKYAFPHQEDDRIWITLNMLENNEILLVVSDNGKGMTQSPEQAGKDSFGLKLVKGLTTDLAGQLIINLQRGTSFHLTFRQSEFYDGKRIRIKADAVL